MMIVGEKQEVSEDKLPKSKSELNSDGTVLIMSY